MRTRSWLAAVFLALSASSPANAQPPALAAVPTDSFAFVTVNAGKMWDAPGFKPLREWFEAQKLGPTDELVGLPVGDIERVTLFLPGATVRNGPLLLVTTKKPYNEAKLLKRLGTERIDRRGGMNAVRTKGGTFETVVLVDDRTLLFVPEARDGELVLAGFLGQLLAKKTDGPLAAALADAANHDVACAIDARPLAGVLQVERERELAPYLALFKAQTVSFTADFDKSATGTLKITFPDEASAKRAGPVLKEGLAAIVEGAKEVAGRGDVGPVEIALLEAYVAVLKAAKVETAGTSVVTSAELPYSDMVAKLSAALPKAYAAAVNSTRGQNNLKQLMLGVFNFEAVYLHFPSDVRPTGNKLLAWSWRVQVLPYVEQNNPFPQLDFEKAWDDPVNLKKLEAMEMPKVFEIPGRPAPKGHTYFRVFSLPKGSKGTARPMFVEGQKGTAITQITDGTSNTFMIVEAGEAVPWYKPDLLAYDGKLPLPQLGDKAADRFIVAMGDGSVRAVRPSKVGEATLRAFITAAGGEVIPVP